MSYARAEQNEKGEWFISPLWLGISSITFKDRNTAVSWAQSLNQAHQRGRDEMASDFRTLIGAAKDEGV